MQLHLEPTLGNLKLHDHYTSFELAHLCLIIFVIFLRSMSALHHVAKRHRLSISNSIFFLCDLQEKFRPLIYRSETVIKKSVFLNKAFNLLEVPCLISEQYPKALGKTMPEIEMFPTTTLFEKRTFSMLGNEDIARELNNSHRKQVRSSDYLILSCTD